MLDLHDREWKEFRICDIFIIKAGKRLTKSDMASGNKPFIGATDNNNGITEFVSNTNISEDSNVLGVNYNGSVVENFYHPYTCIFSDDVKRFQTKQVQGNKYIYLFMKTVILQQKCKYAYGYKFNEKRIIQKYIKYIGNNIQIGGGITPLNQKKWKEFYLSDIFTDIQRGKRLKTADHIQGNIPYVSSSAVNNGVDALIGNTAKIRKFADCLTLANSGSVGKTFYHKYEFIASDHVTALKSDRLNEYSYLFVATIVQRLENKYSFNREINDMRINKEKIVLPIDEFDKPDYAFMEQYVKQQIATLKLQYLQEKMSVTN